MYPSCSQANHHSQPKTYLVQDRLRVEAIPVSPLEWIRRIFSIKGEELIAKCGLDGYFAIRFLRAMLVVFLPLMILGLTILVPVNYHGGKGQETWTVGDRRQNFNVTGLDTLSWQNVPPPKTDRYWTHLVLALVAIVWTLYRIYQEKLHFVKVRQDYLTSPEHRLKASARTILVANIPSEYRSEKALKELFDIFIDNDDRSKLHVWVNRDYSALNDLVKKRRKHCGALEKEELRILRMVEKQYHKTKSTKKTTDDSPQPSSDMAYSSGTNVGGAMPWQRASTETAEKVPRSPKDLEASYDGNRTMDEDALQQITNAFVADNKDTNELWRTYVESSKERRITVQGGDDSIGKPTSFFSFRRAGRRSVSKIAWLRAEVSRLSVEIDKLLPHLDDESRFPLQNSAFIQFERQMAANMAVALTAHHMPGIMSPRFLHVAPHEIVWPNMGLSSRIRFIRTCTALVLFVGMLVLWAIPAFFFGTLSQLEQLRDSTSWLQWLGNWPPWLISLISGNSIPMYPSHVL